MPSAVERSTRSSGASRTVAALVPSANRIGTDTATVLTAPTVRAGAAIASRRVAGLAQREDVGNGTVERGRNIARPAELHHGAGEPAHLEPAAALEVVV